MRVLFLTDDYPPDSFGGAGIVAERLARGLAARGVEVRVLTTVRDPARAGRALADGLVVDRLASDYPLRWRSWVSLHHPRLVRALERLLREFRPDVVHAHNVHIHLSYRSLPVARRAGARVFLTAHDAMSFHYGKLVEVAGSYRLSPLAQIRDYGRTYSPIRNAAIRSSLRSVERIFAVSRALARALSDNGIRRPVQVLHNGIDLAAWDQVRPEPGSLAVEPELAGRRVVLFGGRLAEAKGAPQLVAAMARLAGNVPEAVLLVMGQETPYAGSLLADVRARGLADLVRFTGWISGPALRRAYELARVVCVPSTYLDPFPTINLEAMACARPVVGTRHGGTPEAVEDGRTGFVVDPVDTAALSDRIGRLLSDPDLARRMGEAGRERVAGEFSLARQVDATLAAYTR